MGRLRDKMDADLKLAGRSESTRSHYIGCARLFVKHFRRPAEEMGEPEVKEFLLFLKEERKLSMGRYIQYVASLRFLYEVTLARPEVVATLPWPKLRPGLPEVVGEVQKLPRVAGEAGELREDQALDAPALYVGEHPPGLWVLHHRLSRDAREVVDLAHRPSV